MSGKTDQLARQVERQAQPAIFQIEIELGGVLIVEPSSLQREI